MEEEIALDPAAFDRLWPLTEGRRVVKTRHAVTVAGGLVIEVDVYSGDLAGLVVAEVEFPTRRGGGLLPAARLDGRRGDRRPGLQEPEPARAECGVAASCRLTRSLHCAHRIPRVLRELQMPLCFIEPQDAIRVIAESVGREARRQLLGEVVAAWVDEIPEGELDSHYAKAVADLDEHDLSMLAAWHASLEVGQPVANREFLVKVFPTLGENKREALKIAAGSAARRRSTPASPRRRRWTPCCPTCPASARSRSRASASSYTSGTGSAATTELQLRDHLGGVVELDGVHAQRGGRVAVDLDVVDEHALGRLHAEALAASAVDRRVGLAHPDERRVDDELEDLVDRAASRASAPPTRGRCW